MEQSKKGLRRFINLGKAATLRILPDKFFINYIYQKKIGKKLDLKNPVTFNEKVQWLKLYDRNPDYTKLVDKFEVRKFVIKKIGEEYLIPLIGKYKKFEDINFDELPNQFVLKCTHDSGGVVICKDKSTFDFESAKEKINRALRTNYYYTWREWPYKNVEPKIICEEYMEEETGTELKDYKFMCFNGVVKCSFVALNRNSKTGLNVDFYDLNWKPMPFERHYPKSGSIIKKPINYNKMIELAEFLSEEIPFVRVDFYETNNQIYFGELTFHPGSGLEKFSPVSYDYMLGNWLKLPGKNGENSLL